MIGILSAGENWFRVQVFYRSRHVPTPVNAIIYWSRWVGAAGRFVAFCLFDFAAEERRQ
jgi:hypothetical protein